MNLKQRDIAKQGLTSARDYAKGIESGAIPACKWVKLAIKRDVKDRKTAHKRGLYFDEYAAGRALAFFRYLKHYKGEWRGQTIILEPWQCWIISVIFGWKQADGKRRYREIYEEVARKNGKTIKLAGIGGYMLLMDNEGAPEIYAAAITREQSKRLWRDARKMLSYSAAIRPLIKTKDSENLIECPRNDGFFIPLSRDAESIDGANPHAGLVDELHAHKTAHIYNVIISGMGSRSQPIMWAITTAGAARPKEESICLQKREYACNVLEEKYQDDKFFGIIYTLDAGDDWNDPDTWIKANPNLEYKFAEDEQGRPIMRGSVKRDYLQGEVIKAKNSPIFRYGVLTKNFNIWMSNAVSWCKLDLWDKYQAEYALSSFRNATAVYGGLDLASISDLTSLSLIAIMPNGEKRAWSRSWIPQDRVIEAVQDRGVPYDLWVEQGWLVTTPGNAVDYNFIHAEIMGTENQTGLLDDIPLERIAVDRWAIHQFVKDLREDLQDKLVSMGQGYQSMSPAMKELERLYTSGELNHDGNPVLRWAMGNVVAVIDPSENIKADKKKSPEKIDPAVALIMATGAMLAEYEEEYDSAYEEEIYI